MPIDEVMGLMLGVPGAQGAGALVVTEFTQALGANIIVDGDMEAADTAAWSSSASALLTKSTDNPHGGEQALRITRQDTQNAGATNQGQLVVESYFELTGFARGNGTDASPALYLGFVAWSGTVSALWQPHKLLLRATATTYRPYTTTITSGAWVEWDDLQAHQLTLNEQQVAPSADMRLDVFYTLPGTPDAGTQLWLLPRISDFAAGNYWLALLTYTGSQWDVTLYSVASHSRTSRITAANVSVTDGLRVVMDDDSISLYTTADAGDNWTQRGSTISNSAYQTATGVNTIYTSDVTPTKLVCAPI